MRFEWILIPVWIENFLFCLSSETIFVKQQAIFSDDTLNLGEFFELDKIGESGYPIPKPSRSLWPVPEGLPEEMLAQLPDEENVPVIYETFDGDARAFDQDIWSMELARALVNLGRLKVVVRHLDQQKKSPTE